MCKEIIIDNRTRQRGRIPMPDYPESEWCDFRRDYESGMTLKKIAEKYFCDSRTVKSAILHNRSSSELGKQMVPTKLEPFIDRLEYLYENYIDNDEPFGICEISRLITDQLVSEGYTGGERTVRNYLRARSQPVTDPDKPEKGNGNDQNKDNT